MTDDLAEPHRTPTLDDVAALAGVGRGTVSRAINGSPNVSEHSHALVMAAVEELGYVPNKAARSLVTRRADTVTLVISDSEERFFSEPFFAGVVHGISAALAETSRPLLLAMAQTPRQHRSLETYLMAQHVDVDNVQGGGQATEHLPGIGRRRIAIIQGRGTWPSATTGWSATVGRSSGTGCRSTQPSWKRVTSPSRAARPR